MPKGEERLSRVSELGSAKHLLGGKIFTSRGGKKKNVWAAGERGTFKGKEGRLTWKEVPLPRGKLPLP